MSNVFISFSTRGGVDLEWIATFRHNLEETYSANYGQQELKVWEMSQNEGNFQKGIDDALKKTVILILVLDPTFIQSPQTLDEIQKYQIERRNKGYDEFIIKVVKRRGSQEDELRRLIDSNLLTYHFSKTKPKSKVEEEFVEGSAEYNAEIEKIVHEIRRHEVQHRRKLNTQKMLSRLEEMRNLPKVYVVLGDSTLTDNRVKFINELNETIKRNSNEKIRKVRVLPDDFTFTLFDHEELSELLCEENEYRERCVEAILSECSVVIVPFETNNKSEAEIYLEKIKFQLQAIKVRAQDFNLPVHFLLNIPEILYQNSEFKHEFVNPAFTAYKNIKRSQNQIITIFIDAFLEDLTGIISPQEGTLPSSADRKKRIYLIEYNSSVTEGIPQHELEQEETNRAGIRAYIESFNFTVVPESTSRSSVHQKANDSDTQLRREFLRQSDGIIIYRGIREDETWCQMQQVRTYKDLKALSKETDLKKAVFIDPAQQDKDSYDIYGFQVITNHPPELKDFLCQVQQH